MRSIMYNIVQHDTARASVVSQQTIGQPGPSSCDSRGITRPPKARADGRNVMQSRQGTHGVCGGVSRSLGSAVALGALAVASMTPESAFAQSEGATADVAPTENTEPSQPGASAQPEIIVT